LGGGGQFRGFSTFNTYRPLHYGCSIMEGSSSVQFTMKKVLETSCKKTNIKKCKRKDVGLLKKVRKQGKLN